MEDKVLEILKSRKKALSIEEIDNLLGLTTVEEYKELNEIIKKLEEELIVYRTNKNKFLLLEYSPLRKGILHVNKKGFGFVDLDFKEDDIYISSNNLCGAIHGDTVLVEVISKKGIDKEEGRIVKVLKREFKTLVGELYYKKEIPYLLLDDSRIKVNIKIESGNLLGAVSGHKVVAQITKHLGDNNYIAKIIKVLGHKKDPGVDVLSIVHKYNINDTFSEEVMTETEKINDRVLENELIGRKDLRDEIIFTIDSIDTKDIDDALSLRINEKSNYVLGVHIADVSYYVKEGSEIDKEAYIRGTSIYLADRVIPMLPHKLSNGICSLNENEDRLTITCEMEINNRGEIINYDIFESIIRSKKKMTYDSVNKILENNEVPEGYEEYSDVLKEMKNLSSILRKNKINRGYIDFDLDEAKIIVDDKGKAIDVKLREHGIAQDIIEDFMIAANETVANYITYMDLPFVYRIHDYPKEEKIMEFLKFIGLLGYKIQGKPNDISPKSVQKIIEYLKDKKEFKILSNLLLRCMKKAEYSPDNIGHYGLASKCYTHFTAPIRRYPDMTVHRLLRAYIFGKKINAETIKYWAEKLVPVCTQSSFAEKNFMNCEREVNDMKMAEYMMGHIGEEYIGHISSVMNFGLFVQLDNLIEGLVRISDMEDDYYIFDETSLSLIGERTNKIYRIGDEIKVRVKYASKEERIIDFEIVKE